MQVIINITNLDADDERAARLRIQQENERLPVNNRLPFGTNAELKASYEPLLLRDIGNIHESRIQQSTSKAVETIAVFKDVKSIFADADPSKYAAMKAAALAASV